MSEFIVSISEEVREQLRSIARWYARESGSVDVGVHWHAGFIAAIDSLVENPRGCALAQQTDMFPYELRMLLYGSRQAQVAPGVVSHRGQHRAGTVNPTPVPKRRDAR